MIGRSNLYLLEGTVQHYSWGGNDFLPGLLKKENIGKQPFAEYWMGAHANAPSVVIDQAGTTEKLDEFIRKSPVTRLGKQVSEAFGRLPYLFKVLDVKDMLSIQVHPNKEEARMNFEREQKLGIPLQAPHRNYKDDNHKPELMVALSEFYLLHGFKDRSAMEKILASVPELGFLQESWKKDAYKGVYKQVMEMGQEEVNQRLRSLIDRILPLYKSHQLSKTQEDFWAARAFGTFCTEGNIDRGIFSIYLFNLVHLKKGEAIFQDAGILHAYLEGQNLEIMANSDNVLRGGLTNKHVDVPELMKHVQFEATIPQTIHPTNIEGESIFRTPAPDFELREIKLPVDHQLTLQSTTLDIFLVMEGKIRASSGGEPLQLSRGSCFMAPAGTSLDIYAEQPSVIYHATVPFSQD